MKKRYLACLLMAVMSFFHAAAQDAYSGTLVADEGAWCWFADPRALHYENAEGTINATYIGYIDIHQVLMTKGNNNELPMTRWY